MAIQPVNAAFIAGVLLITIFRPAAAVTLGGLGIVGSSSLTRRVQRLHANVNRSDVDANSMSLALDIKPIRISRGGGSGKDAEKKHKHHEGQGTCGNTVKVDSGSDKWALCPNECPYYVQNREDDDFCTFACVAENECAQLYPKTPIGDKGLGVCRSCVVDGCKECDNSVSEDKCAKCQAGYDLRSDGLCYFKYGGQWVTIVGYVLIGILSVVVIWIIDFAIRPTCNEEGLSHGLDFRDKQKLRAKKDQNGERNLFPLTTNLMTTQVAGPGMSLHFNFQAALIAWAIFIACVWMCFAGFVDDALWVLGTRAFGTARSNCILVAWGYETQQRLMWTKVLFLWIVYIGSFLFAMLYGIYQLRSFQHIDHQHKTMKDFAAMIVGLPKMSGEKPVEEDLKAHLERLTKVKVVGVSVAWDYQDDEETIDKALAEDMQAEEDCHLGAAQTPRSPEFNPVRSAFWKFEQTVFDLAKPTEEDETSSEGEKATDSVDELLKRMQTSQRAFAVFETQEARDQAIQSIGDGFAYEGASDITMEEISAEPDTVQWVNFGHSTAQEKILKLIAGFGIIALACLFWAVVFYAPYAYYVLTFNYENGREPGFVVGFAFSMIVVVGNAIMYEVCNKISEWVGFRFKDDKEACYMILYCIACMFNVLLDFVTTYMTVEKVMEGLGFRTYFGVPLQDVPTFTEKFETYGMQRSLAENTYSYAFPSTFLIPFLIEPLPSIILPLLLGKMVVKSHPEVQRGAAEEWLALVPMEMGRYADLLLNMILGILIFYFPGGFTWKLFLGMAASHVWIYVFDHVRVLRAIPSCTFASYDIEWYCQAMLAPIIGIMASCIVFKSNCEDGYHCLTGFPLIAACCAAWFLHVALHMLALCYVVPRFGKPEPEVDPCKGETFADLAQQVPSSWFTANPIYCLRSKHHYKHSPPCSHFMLGKERYMRVNKEIGCFFEEK